VTPIILLSPELLQLALGLNRIVSYAGYVLLAGTLTFFALVWPQGRADRRLVSLAAIGAGLMIISTIAGPLIQILFAGRPIGDVLTPLDGTAAIVRLAALACVGFYFVDILRGPIVGWRRVVSIVLVIVIAATMVTQSDAVGGNWQLVKIIATAGHVLAIAAWIGGLVALAAVLIPRENLQELDRLIPRFSIIATLSVITLVVTGIVHAIAVAGGIRPLVTSYYGLVLLVKVSIFGLMLLMGNQGRRYAARVAFQRLHTPATLLRRSSGVQSLAVVMGAELTMAFVILSTTSILVMVAPSP
jgi:putative copper export protein